MFGDAEWRAWKTDSGIYWLITIGLSCQGEGRGRELGEGGVDTSKVCLLGRGNLGGHPGSNLPTRKLCESRQDFKPLSA